MFGCGNNGNYVTTGSDDSSFGTTEVSSDASYNVNIYDANDDWYETGLLIESFDNKNFVKINDGRYELLESDKEEYRYMIENDGETFYVK